MWKVWHKVDFKKDTCLQYDRQSKMGEHCHVWPQLEMCTVGDSNFLHSPSVNDYENSASLEFGLINKFEQVGRFANTESANNEDQLCIKVK